jgi:hypothetical protein
MKMTLKEIAPLYIKAIKEISRLNTEIEKLKKEKLSTFEDAEAMAYLSYHANKLDVQASLDKFKIKGLLVKNAELKFIIDNNLIDSKLISSIIMGV